MELFPETEIRFFGTAIDILDFHINFVSNEHGEVEHLILDVGFRSVRYNRIKSYGLSNPMDSSDSVPASPVIENSVVAGLGCKSFR